MTERNMKMPDLSQTIYQLEEEVKRADYIDIDYLDCVDVNVLKDALTLLKAQEPRVETWEEAQANVQDGPFIIFEVRDSTGSEVDFGVLTGDFYEMSEGSVLTVCDFLMMKDDYGKRFRLWTSRPDQATMEATPWNAQK